MSALTLVLAYTAVRAVQVPRSFQTKSDNVIKDGMSVAIPSLDNEVSPGRDHLDYFAIIILAWEHQPHREGGQPCILALPLSEKPRA
ncbi:hypothetical protein [Massilia sp. YMA4]|uniref:hypothetical protein n=1 Tax=Massilia sp. YMA4 TaxID=1593482 RepID=UPI00158221E2|nr:hypothetical protein [Massilia sp. YMA4]